MRLEEPSRERFAETAVGNHYAETAFKGVADVGVLGGLDLGDQAVEPGTDRRIRDGILFGHGFKRPRSEHEAANELEVLELKRCDPRRKGLSGGQGLTREGSIE